MGWLPGLPPFLPSLSLLPEDCLLRQLGPDRGGQGAWAVSRLLRARSVQSSLGPALSAFSLHPCTPPSSRGGWGWLGKHLFIGFAAPTTARAGERESRADPS